jgi:uncharacterized protein (DUF1697 family)
MIYSNGIMATYILLVRGVTHSGRNKIPMARFRDVLEKAGFARVRTYILSGNALVDTELPAHTVEKSVRDLIRNQIGPDLVVLARTGAQLEEALEANPFTKGFDISRVFFSLFCRKASGREGQGASVSGSVYGGNSHSGKIPLT